MARCEPRQGLTRSRPHVLGRWPATDPRQPTGWVGRSRRSGEWCGSNRRRRRLRWAGGSARSSLLALAVQMSAVSSGRTETPAELGGTSHPPSPRRPGNLLWTVDATLRCVCNLSSVRLCKTRPSRHRCRDANADAACGTSSGRAEFVAQVCALPSEAARPRARVQRRSSGAASAPEQATVTSSGPTAESRRASERRTPR